MIGQRNMSEPAAAGSVHLTPTAAVLWDLCACRASPVRSTLSFRIVRARNLGLYDALPTAYPLCLLMSGAGQIRYITRAVGVVRLLSERRSNDCSWPKAVCRSATAYDPERTVGLPRSRRSQID